MATLELASGFANSHRALPVDVPTMLLLLTG